MDGAGGRVPVFSTLIGGAFSDAIHCCIISLSFFSCCLHMHLAAVWFLLLFVAPGALFHRLVSTTTNGAGTRRLSPELTGAPTDGSAETHPPLSRVRWNDLLNEAASRQDKSLIYS